MSWSLIILLGLAIVIAVIGGVWWGLLYLAKEEGEDQP